MNTSPTSARERRQPRSALWEVIWVFGGLTAATVALSHLGRIPPLGEYVHVAVGTLCLVTAVQRRPRQPQGLARYGLRLGGLLEPPAEELPPGLLSGLKDVLQLCRRALPQALRETGWALLVALLIFPPFAAGFYLFHAPQQPFTFHLPPELPSYLVGHLLLVGLPEEALFRGYLQGRLSDHFPGTGRLLGARLSWGAWLLQAGLFGLMHFAVDLHPARLAVFFPALLFGWLRELRGGIGASIVLHAASNLLSDVLVRGWL